MKKIKVNELEAGIRLDVFLTKKFKELSRSKIQKNIINKEILVNEKEVSSHYKLKEDDIIFFGVKVSAKTIEEKKIEIKKDNDLFKKIKIIKKTKDYLVLSKPAGLIVHGAEHIKEKTLVDWLIKKYPKIKKIGDDPFRPGIVHRLDREVSGLIVVALNNDSFDDLKNQFMSRSIKKEYTTLVYGKTARDNDTINFSIKRSSDGHKMAAVPYSFGEKLETMKPFDFKKSSKDNKEDIVDKEIVSEKRKKKKGDNARRAISKFEIKKRFINYTLLEVMIKTGRTHQIRVHMYAYGHSIVGDNLYSTKKTREKNVKIGLNRVFLQATKLCFLNLKGEEVCSELKLDEKLEDLLGVVK